MELSSPVVTVIIPMRNEEDRIARCLDSILANDFPHDRLEILVVDGRSTDGSRQIVGNYAARCPLIHILENRDRIVPQGLNLGIREARGDIIMIMGAHCEYPRNYISTCVRELDRTHADVVGGVLNTRPGSHTLVARAVALVTQHLFGVGGSAFRTRKSGGFVDTVPYGAYRRNVFERVGLFNKKLARNQDFEFNARVRGAGGKLFLASELEINYYNVPTFTRFASQAFRNGLWLSRMWMTSPSSFRVRHAIPLAFVSVLLASAILGTFIVLAGQLSMVVVGAYVAAAATSTFQICRREGLKLFFLLIAMFFTLHVGYGIGTAAGLFVSGATATKRAVRLRFRPVAVAAFHKPSSSAETPARFGS